MAEAQLVKGIQKEISVFEITENSNIGNNAYYKEHFFLQIGIGISYKLSSPIIYKRTDYNKNEKYSARFVIEEKRDY